MVWARGHDGAQLMGRFAKWKKRPGQKKKRRVWRFSGLIGNMAGRR